MADLSTRDAAAVCVLETAAGQEDPYPAYRELRAGGPVVRAGRRRVLVLSYDLCRLVLQDQRFSATGGAWRDATQPGWRTHPAVEEACRFLLLRDPPEHGRLRRIMQAGFSRTRLAALTGRIDQAVAGVLDHLESRLRRDGVADFVDTVVRHHGMTFRGFAALPVTCQGAA